MFETFKIDILNSDNSEITTVKDIETMFYFVVMYLICWFEPHQTGSVAYPELYTRSDRLR